MKKLAIIFSLMAFTTSCGDSENEVKLQDEKVKEEMEKTSETLFDNLEEDLKEDNQKEKK